MPANNSRPVGIDLGTTRSAVACVDENGRPRVLADRFGVSLVPSVVLFEDDQVLVGEVARDNGIAVPEQTIECVKRRIGDPAWRFRAGNREYDAVEISALILAEMRRIASDALGSPVTEAVITVPAYFHDRERSRTILAAERAGLNVLKIVKEPTAAAMYYSFEEETAAPIFLVYDLGGGTFDITIMQRDGPNALEPLTTNGNHFLGGKNWDDRLVDHVAGLFVARYDADPRLDAPALYDLNLRCEHAKIVLSEKARTQIVCQFAGRALSAEITREAFEDITRDLLQLTEDLVDRAFKEIGVPAVPLALLVGGSSRMPMVRRMMRRKAAEVRMSRNPDHCVALGAALEAARLSAANEGLYKPAVRRFLQDTTVTDRTPHALGLIAVGRGTLVNATIIPKNTRIPCEMSRDDITTNFDDQTTVSVHLVQGEDADALASVPVATYEFSGITRRKAGESIVRITYRYNENNVVEVSGVDVKSGRPLEQRALPLVDLIELQKQITQPPRTGKRPRQVALLIDSSGSMSSRMEEAKQACLQFIDETDFGSVEVGIIQFGIDSDASVLHGLSRDADSLRREVDSLDADGGTPMHEALELALRMLGVGDRGVDGFIVLFTDGHPDDRASTLDATASAKRSGISILCIGVGSADQELLDEIATAAEQVEFSKSDKELVTSFGNIARLISQRRV